ncbi:hypothetical protein BOX37_14030 [Nocardia mangyaensis]|uniref:Uncharacterized protein n=1 Tax=Nocardia mangyaensis TaxID=2213200 RepID=A0A1J0VS84_9NOCA|nr:hypothetical protein [Nocardia mangyaensis]APE34881.1 hypothetical protein BOX37_14030 [Nocardia mangyaensis]
MFERQANVETATLYETTKSRHQPSGDDDVSECISVTVGQNVRRRGADERAVPVSGWHEVDDPGSSITGWKD